MVTAAPDLDVLVSDWTLLEPEREFTAAGFTDVDIQITHRVHDQAALAIVRATVPT